MKKKILVIVLCLICLIGLTACSENNKETSVIFLSKYINLEIIEDIEQKENEQDKLIIIV